MEIPKQFEHLKSKFTERLDDYFQDRGLIYKNTPALESPDITMICDEPNINLAFQQKKMKGFACKVLSRLWEHPDVYLGIIKFIIEGDNVVCDVGYNEALYTAHDNTHIKEYVKKFIPINLFEQLVHDTNGLLHIEWFGY